MKFHTVPICLTYFSEKRHLWQQGKLGLSDSRMKYKVIYYFRIQNRYFTHGYDFYAPGEAVLYHLYSRAHRPTAHSDNAMSSIYQQHKEISLGIVHQMLSMALQNSEKEIGSSLAALNSQYFSLGA
jgi:hypothetical protein